MAVRDQFNEDEWFLLSSTPALIAASVSAADPGGLIGAAQEMSASMRASVQGLEKYPDSELIQGLLEKAMNWEQAKEKMQDYRERSKQRIEQIGAKSPEALKAATLEDAQRAVTLVDERCSAGDAAAYRDWMLDIARSVAEAAREGSFFNFGSDRISDAEKAWIDQLGSAIGSDTAVLSA